MNKLTFIIIIFLLHSFPSFGDPNGNGIICKFKEGDKQSINWNSYIEDGKPTEVGYLFREDMVTFHYINRKNDDIKFRLNSNKKLRDSEDFRTTNEEIEWDTFSLHGESYYYVLNRKNLILKKMTWSKNKTLVLRQCKVFPEKTYFEKMKKLSDVYQKNYNDKNKGNKI